MSLRPFVCEVEPTCAKLLFEEGSIADCAFILSKGSVLYSQEPAIDTCDSETTLESDGQLLCEAALWTEWLHVGTLEALSRGNVLAIQVSPFVQITTSSPGIAHITVEYGRTFVVKVRKAIQEQAKSATDTCSSGTEFSL